MTPRFNMKDLDESPIPKLLGKKVSIRWVEQIVKKPYSYRITEYNMNCGLIKLITMGRGKKLAYWVHVNEIADIKEATNEPL